MTALGLAGVLLLIAGNAFFVTAEYALVTAPRVRVQELADDGSRGAATALRLRSTGTAGSLSPWKAQIGMWAISFALVLSMPPQIGTPAAK